MATTMVKSKFPPKRRDVRAQQSPDRRAPLTTTEASEYLGVTERWIRRAVAERRLPYLKLGRLLRFHPLDLDTYMDARRVEAEETP